MTAILCRIGWMAKYDGTEQLYRGRMKWEEDDCGEAWNFLPGNDSIIRGFTMLTAKNADKKYTGTININNLGANTKDKYIDGITIIFYAPRPLDDENYVVGWYENAKAFRTWRNSGKDNEYRSNQPYSFKVDAGNAFLIPEKQRTIKILTAISAKINGNTGSYPGQKSVFFRSSNSTYVDSVVNEVKKLRVASALDNDHGSVSEGRQPFKSNDDFASDLEEPSKRTKTTISRIIRDNAKTKKLKIEYEYKCQICNSCIELSKNQFYAEVHHLRPLGGEHKGSDEYDNMIVLCPNHHAIFDFGVPYFLSPSKVRIGSETYNLISRHTIAKGNIGYHNDALHKGYKERSC